MNDLGKMAIADIDRHKHNFKLFMTFLKLNKIYFFKKFLFSKRTPYDIFQTINENYPRTYNGSFSSQLSNEIDKRWALMFIYVPYLGGYWDNHFFITRSIFATRMSEISESWKRYLYNHKLD